MQDEISRQQPVAVAVRPGRDVAPALVLLTAGLAVVAGIAVCVAAVLTPAPAAALPPVVVICVGCPIFGVWDVPAAVARLRAERAGGRALARLRHGLAQLPETDHPLGL